MIGTANLIGARFGNYEIRALLGSGGMASVYRGFDVNLGREVAIKVLSAAAALQPGLAARFRQEAQLIAGLHHPHIVKVYDFGEQEGLTYMVQELLPGPTLERRLRELAARGERMAREDVLTIVAQLAGALDAAHAAGIIHRDVKPANAIWNAAGALTLTDFGIAKNTLGETHHTQIGMVIGTPNYISPEQARSQPLTPASDIYSLGVVLYELLASKPPFEGDTLSVVMDHIQTPPPPIRTIRPDLPADVEAVVQQALAKDPAARFRRAAVLARALEQAWTTAPAAVARPEAIHNQATRLWQGKPSAAPAPAPAAIRPIQGTPAPARSRPAPRAEAAVPGRRRGSALPLLGGLLAILLLAGFVLASRGASRTTAPAPAAAPTNAPAAADAAPTPEPEPTAAPEPTAPPAPEPTAAPEPTTPPTPQPTAAPTPPATPLDSLRAMLEDGIRSGQVGRGGQELLKHLDEARQALAEDNARRAGDQLRDLARKLLEGVRNGEIDPSFAGRALDQIAAVAAGNGLAVEIQPPIDGSKDKGKDKDKDND